MKKGFTWLYVNPTFNGCRVHSVLKFLFMEGQECSEAEVLKLADRLELRCGTDPEAKQLVALLRSGNYVFASTVKF